MNRVPFMKDAANTVLARLAFLARAIVSHILFFFQAEDGIRDVAVTGVQTCALPIFFGGKLGYGSEVKKIRFMTPVDGVYGVIDSGVQDRKAARGMHGCRLGTGSANNHEIGRASCRERV